MALHAIISGGARGGGGAVSPMISVLLFVCFFSYFFFFFCLSVQRSVMAMIIPLSHSEKIFEIFLKSGKNVSRSPPPPPSSFSGAGAKNYACAAVRETFPPPPPPTPWRRPWPSVSSIRCKNEALKQLYFKSIIKCFKRVKIDKWPHLPYSVPPIDSCVRIKGNPDCLLNEYQTQIAW